MHGVAPFGAAQMRQAGAGDDGVGAVGGMIQRRQHAALAQRGADIDGVAQAQVGQLRFQRDAGLYRLARQVIGAGDAVDDAPLCVGIQRGDGARHILGRELHQPENHEIVLI